MSLGDTKVQSFGHILAKKREISRSFCLELKRSFNSRGISEWLSIYKLHTEEICIAWCSEIRERIPGKSAG
jgi:hypothetical protein